MTLVAPVNLPYNVKTLWFDPSGLDIHADDKLVVKTARGIELGVAEGEPFEVDYEKVKALKSPLQPVLRIATDEDLAKAEEMERLSKEAMPVFREMAHETSEDMHPVSVEYMLDGDKAVFYFEAEKRIDFRELVRKLASTFHVRIDMRQIGVRDEARIVGGIAHCGQVVCCKRLGGEFKPVSIRMAKDQDLSLNSQKISGLCGRLMCCLRYEEEAYKEFKSKAPKMGAKVQTPDGEGKVVEHDVPRETIGIRVQDEKPVKIPLSAIVDISEDRKSCAVEDDAWEEAIEAATSAMYGTSQILDLPSFTGEDKLGSAKVVHNPSRSSKDSSSGKSRSKSSRGGKKGSSSGSGRGKSQSSKSEEPAKRKQRRRSTKINSASGEKETTSKPASQKKDGGSQGGSGSRKHSGKGASKGGVRPGQKSSGLSKDRGGNQGSGNGGNNAKDQNANKGSGEGSGHKRRRRRRRSSGGKGGQGQSGGDGSKGAQASGDSGAKDAQ